MGIQNGIKLFGWGTAFEKNVLTYGKFSEDFVFLEGNFQKSELEGIENFN